MMNTQTDAMSFEEEIERGERFRFGENWKALLTQLDEARIAEAEKSILSLLNLDTIEGRSFLDIGSGSGLFSLSARRLGAVVSSFDYDPESVACTNYLRSKYFPDNNDWDVQRGSALDEPFLKSLGSFDIVYSWGVLHHTGNMWKAIENVTSLVKANGILCIAIYNDQGPRSKLWRKAKMLYCSGFPGKIIVGGTFLPYFFARAILSSIVRRQNLFSRYKENRGMSIVRDWFDWLGGFPYEVASVDEIFQYHQARGFTLRNIVTTNGWGCNQFVFVKRG